MFPPDRLTPGSHFLRAVIVLAFALGGCDEPKVSIDGHNGVPLAQLVLSGRTLSGRTVHEVTLLGPDTVHVVQGDTLTIRVDGDARAQAALRFVLNDGKLGIGRQPDANVGNGTATVTITAPSIDHLVMAGSGTMSSDRLTGKTVGVIIGGSGHIVTAGIEANQFDAEILGSGSFTGSGHAGKLALTLAGPGEVDLARLKTDEAAIDVTGSGTGDLASDGRVTGSVVESGVVHIHGKAHCDVGVTGSGRIICQP